LARWAVCISFATCDRSAMRLSSSASNWAGVSIRSPTVSPAFVGDGGLRRLPPDEKQPTFTSKTAATATRIVLRKRTMRKSEPNDPHPAIDRMTALT